MRLRAWRTLTQGMSQSCDEEAAEVTSWPINQIQAAVQPNEQQSALLDALGNAVVKASDEVHAHCPTNVAFTPTARLEAMHQRLQALVDAVNIVSPPLETFYDSLSDEQKARFNGMAPPPQQAQAPQSGQAPPSVQAQCNASVMAWPTDQIDHLVQARRCAAGETGGVAVGRRAGRQHHQSGVSDRDAGDAAEPASGGRQAAAGNVASGRNRRSRRSPTSTIR